MTDGRISRRRVLRGIGAGAVISASNAGGYTDFGPDDWDPGAIASGDVVTPETIQYRGHTINIRPARVDSCLDYNSWADTQPEAADSLPTPGVTTRKIAIRVLPSDIETESEGGFMSSTVRVTEVNGCEYRSNPSIEILDWRPDYELTEACRLSYCEMFRRAMEHEIRHVEDDRTKFEPAFKQWVTDTDLNFVVTADDENAAANEVQRRLAAIATEFAGGDRTLADGSYMEGSSKWTHKRIGDSIDWDCESCADCREVGGDNWTYRDVETWQLRVHARADWNVGDREEDTKTTLTSVYDGTFELDQVPLNIVRRAIGGAGAVRETRRRIRNAREALGSQSTSDGLLSGVPGPQTFVSKVPDAVDALTGGVDVVSDGQPPLVWRGRGSVSGRVEITHNQTVDPPCADREHERGRQVLASGTVSPTEMDSEAFVAVVPTHNAVRCFWPDVFVPGRIFDIDWECIDRELEERREVTEDSGNIDPFANLDEDFSGTSNPDPETRGFRVYGGAWGIMRHQAEQVRRGAKRAGGYEQSALDETTDNFGQFLRREFLTGRGLTSRVDAPVPLVSGGGQPLFQLPNPFWTIINCQRGALSESFSSRLYGHLGSVHSRNARRYDSHIEPYREDGMVPVGSESVSIRLETLETDHGEERHTIECGGFTR